MTASTVAAYRPAVVVTDDTPATAVRQLTDHECAILRAFGGNASIAQLSRARKLDPEKVQRELEALCGLNRMKAARLARTGLLELEAAPAREAAAEDTPAAEPDPEPVVEFDTNSSIELLIAQAARSRRKATRDLANRIRDHATDLRMRLSGEQAENTARARVAELRRQLDEANAELARITRGES